MDSEMLRAVLSVPARVTAVTELSAMAMLEESIVVTFVNTEISDNLQNRLATDSAALSIKDNADAPWIAGQPHQPVRIDTNSGRGTIINTRGRRQIIVITTSERKSGF